ncbi:MAG: beta-ketoacyl synthase chain length factor [Spongiibacteraceae bacterium]
MRALPFNLLRWSAWAPGLNTVEAWQGWAEGRDDIAGDDSLPELKFIAPMLRRRFSRLSRMALQVSYDCLQERNDVRTIFCSRHGEIHRTKALLDDLVKQEPISPMGFSLSVHNTASGLYSIASNNHAPSSAIAAGLDTLEMAMVDALGHLQRQPDKPVLVVLADEPLPGFYQPYDSEAAQPYALGLLLGAADTDIEGFDTIERLSLAAQPFNGLQPTAALPHGLQFLHFLLNQHAISQTMGERLQWTWQR